MLKRPLMGLGIALVAGVAAGWSDISWIAVVVAAISTVFLMKRWTDSSYKYIVGLSVFFVVGFCRTIMSAEDETYRADEIQGTLCKVQEKEKVNYLFVEDTEGRSVLVIANKSDFVTEHYYKGQIYQIRGEAENFEKAGNPGQFDEASYYKSQGVVYRIWADEILLLNEGDCLHRTFRWLEYLKEAMCRFYEQCMDDEGSGILQAAVLGERRSLDSDLKRYYQENGWMHLITTSGLHLAFIAMTMYKQLRKMTMPLGLSTGIAFVLMLAYGYMTDFGDSMIRAMGMMILELMAKILGRRTDAWTSLSLLASCILFLHPERLRSVGFVLTYTAVAGMEFGKWLSKQWRADKKKRWKESLCIQTGIFVITLPVLAYSMYEIPVLGFVYNFFMIPLISFIVPVAFIAGIFGVYRVPILEHLAVGVLEGMDQLFKMIHRLPSKVWICGCPSAWQFALFGLGMVLCIWWIGHKMLKWGVLVMIISCCILIFVHVRENQVIFMDVGQGDGICILTDDGQAVLVDGGSSDVNQVFTYRIQPLLKYYGIDQIDAWYLTHGDRDHVSGIEEALQGNIHIEHIFMPDIPGDETLNAIGSRAKQKYISVNTMKVGHTVWVDDFEIQCLYPSMAWCTGDKNNDSLVLNVRFQSKTDQSETDGVSILLTGDLEAEGEKILIENRYLEKVDILKVAHHGSSGGTSLGFLKEVQPMWAIISCGQDNRYGHPHRETLERLESVDCQWVSTALQGAVHIQMNLEGYTIYGYQKQD